MAIDPAPAAPEAPAPDGDATISAPPVSAAGASGDVTPGDGAEAPTDAGPPASPPSAPTTPAAEPGGRAARRRRVKARQVQRVITRIDPWSMLKVSLLFALSLWLIVVVAGVLLWRVAVSTGTIGNFENFLATSLGEESFRIDGGQIFQGSVVVGLVLFATGAVFAVVTSVLYNLIAGVVGGVRTTVVELETVRTVDEPPAGS